MIASRNVRGPHAKNDKLLLPVLMFWWGNLRESDHLDELRVDGSIMFKWIFRKWYEERGLY